MLDAEVFRQPKHNPITINGESFNLSEYPYLDVVMTDRCNSKCGFCIGDLLHEKLDGNLEIFQDQIKYAVDELGVKEILLLGGEPTIAPMLMPLLNWLGDEYGSAGQVLNKVCMTSNGKKLRKKEFRRELFSHYVLTHLNLSVMSLDPVQQHAVHGTSNNLTLDELADIYYDCQEYGVHLRVNTNVFKGNHDTEESIRAFVHAIQDSCDSVKFSPLLKTDSFSVIPEVNEFNATHLLSEHDYDDLFEQAAWWFALPGGIRVINPNTFGFVKYDMIFPREGFETTIPVIFNHNHRGRMLQMATGKAKQINNIKLLPTGDLSRSWNRECAEHIIRRGSRD